jgi:hypothetical protein
MSKTDFILGAGAPLMLGIGSHLDNFKHCGTNLDKKPIPVPPTWHKEKNKKIKSINHV